MFALYSTEAASLAITSSPSQRFTTTLASGQRYAYVASVASYVLVGGASVAATSTNMYVPAGVIVVLDATEGTKVASLAVSTSGTATLTRVLAYG